MSEAFVCADRDCGPICDFCQWYRFNGDHHGAYVGKGECVHPGHPRPSEPYDGCEDYVCSHWPEADPELVAAHLAANRKVRA